MPEDPPMHRPEYDVVVVGSGNAGFSAALSAAEHGAKRVLLVDKCPPEWAGGNSYFTAGAYRTVFDGLEDVLSFVTSVDSEKAKKIDMSAYTNQDFWNDLMRVTNGRADPELGKVLVDESREAVGWLAKKGIKFELSFNRQAYEVDGRIKFWGGMVLAIVDGGKGLIAQHTEAATRAGIEIRYSAPLTGLIVQSGRVIGVKLKNAAVYCSAVILAAGGFEASSRLRAQYLGPNWDLAHVRGTPYNTGDGLEILLRDVNAKFVGNWSGCHSVAWDANSPPNSGSRELTNQFTKSGYPLGVMINSIGDRFVDEGVDMRNFTYAKFGREILQQPGSFAFQIWDKVGMEWLRVEEYGDDVVAKVSADTIEELASKLVPLGLTSADKFIQTIKDYNEAVSAHRKENPKARFNPSVKDGLSTQSSKQRLVLAKSNWALPIQEGPFVAVKVTCGITFTFGGVAVNPRNAAVISNADGSDIPGLWAAGEIVGGCFFGNYPGGSGLTLGAVLGRKAGKDAARSLTSDTDGVKKAV